MTLFTPHLSAQLCPTGSGKIHMHCYTDWCAPTCFDTRCVTMVVWWIGRIVAVRHYSGSHCALASVFSRSSLAAVRDFFRNRCGCGWCIEAISVSGAESGTSTANKAETRITWRPQRYEELWSQLKDLPSYCSNRMRWGWPHHFYLHFLLRRLDF